MHDIYYYYNQCNYQSQQVVNMFDKLSTEFAEKLYNDICYTSKYKNALPSTIEKLSNISANVKNRQLVSHLNRTLLTTYVSNKHVDINIVKALVTESNLDFVDNYGNTPLHSYCTRGDSSDIEIIKLLKTYEIMKKSNEHKMIPLMIYLENHKYNVDDDVVLELLNIENINMVDDQFKKSLDYYHRCNNQTDKVNNAYYALKEEYASIQLNHEREKTLLQNLHMQQYIDIPPKSKNSSSCCIIS
jgi:hypothetical protein